ncbi:MAG: glycosyltransferase family 4 protein, partial [Thermoanaerobaculia bacterium]
MLGFCDYFAGSSSGGIERATAEVYRRLSERGARMMVVSIVPGERDELVEVGGIDTRVVPGTDLSPLIGAQLTISARILGVAERVIGDFAPDVLHASGLHFAGSAAAAILARRHDIPLVTTGHVASPAALSLPIRTAVAAYEQVIGRRILRRSCRVIAVSAAVAAHLRRLGADNPAVVHNGVDRDRFAPASRTEDPHVVFVGRLIANKGPDAALAAFGAVQYPGARLTFVGDGPMRRSLEEAAQRIGPDIRFMGNIGDVAPVLNEADILIRPSQTEGQSLAILEAMAAGVCVLATDISAHRELLDGGRCGELAIPGDRMDLAVRLRRLLQDEASRRRIASAARQRAAAYTWEECAAGTGLALSGAA